MPNQNPLSNETKATINEAVRECFALVGLDYDAPDLRIVPLFEMITSHPILIKELPPEKRLTAELAVDCIRQEMGFPAQNYLHKANKLSGFIYAAQSDDQLFGCIFTDANEPTARRRFSAAHELAHYLLHFAPIAEREAGKFLSFSEGISFSSEEAYNEAEDEHEIRLVRDFEADESYNLGVLLKTWDYEQEADYFAAELLMPRVACLTLAQNYGSKFGKNKNAVVRRLATEFLTSFDAMNRRLQDLEFFDYDGN